MFTPDFQENRELYRLDFNIFQVNDRRLDLAEALKLSLRNDETNLRVLPKILLAITSDTLVRSYKGEKVHLQEYFYVSEGKECCLIHGGEI